MNAFRRAFFFPFLGSALAALCGCGDGGAPSSEPASSVAITAADRELARGKFETVCFTCHGMQGAGDGPASIGLVPQPRNFQDPAWQDAVTDRHIETIIVKGGAAVGKAITMPSNPDLNDKPAVVAALRERVRGFRKEND
jgi:hypothetical protein